VKNYKEWGGRTRKRPNRKRKFASHLPVHVSSKMQEKHFGKRRERTQTEEKRGNRLEETGARETHRTPQENTRKKGNVG